MADKPEDQHVLIWTHPDKRSRWFTSVPAAAEYVASVNGSRDVYVGVGLAGKDHGPTHRCVSEEITGVTGMWADLDLLSVIGRYQLLQKIGEGGMGEVWLADQKEPVRRRVALKLIKAGMNSREVVARFESERQALALMDHQLDCPTS